MKKIFTVSLLAILTATAARADIASKQYVDDAVGGVTVTVPDATDTVKGIVVVDSVLNADSTNPVQNKVVLEALENIDVKEDGITTFHIAPNAVTTDEILNNTIQIEDLSETLTGVIDGKQEKLIAGDNITIDDTNKISSTYSYTLPVATPTVLGGVKSGNDIAVDGDGVVTVSHASAADSATNATNDAEGRNIVSTYATKDDLSAVDVTIDPATKTAAGIVKVGDNINVTADGTISVAFPEDKDTTYTAGDNITITNGVISTHAPVNYSAGTNISLDGTVFNVPTANGDTPGVVRAGSNITIADGVISTHAPATYSAGTNISLDGTTFNVATANGDALGVVKSGSDVTITNGAMTVNHAGSADTATSATKATQDAAGNVITEYYATKDELSTVDVELTPATDTALGGVKSGNDISVNGEGVVTVTHATSADSATTATTATSATTATTATTATKALNIPTASDGSGSATIWVQ